MTLRRAAASVAGILLVLLLVLLLGTLSGPGQVPRPGAIPTVIITTSVPGPTVTASPSPPAQPRACDGSWDVSGFKPRYMAYDVVVANPADHRMGPEIKGRDTASVLAETESRLCTDAALLYDLESYNEHGLTIGESAAVRLRGIRATLALSRAALRTRVASLLGLIKAGKPHLEQSEAAYQSWYYVKGASPNDVPALASGGVGPVHSDLLVYTNEHGQRRALRLECGDQPFTQ